MRLYMRVYPQLRYTVIVIRFRYAFLVAFFLRVLVLGAAHK